MAVVVDDTTIILENGTETVELDIIDTRGGGYVSATRVDGDVIHPSYPVEDFQLAENPEISRIDANELFRKGSEVAAARVSD